MIVLYTIISIYLFQNASLLLFLNPPDPLRRMYTRSFFRATWVLTAMVPSLLYHHPYIYFSILGCRVFQGHEYSMETCTRSHVHSFHNRVPFLPRCSKRTGMLYSTYTCLLLFSSFLGEKLPTVSKSITNSLGKKFKSISSSTYLFG